MKKINKLKPILKNNKILIIASIIFFVFLITVRIINNLAIVEGNTTQCSNSDKGNMGNIENSVASNVGLKVLIENNIQDIQNNLLKVKAVISKKTSGKQSNANNELKKLGEEPK
tara:strand:+ start:451 stop:792 length:342 start_codon:yes stop_codon:yes gene_type:complete